MVIASFSSLPTMEEERRRIAAYQGTVAQRSVTQVGTEETWFGAQVPTSQVVGSEECSIPAGEQVKIVGLGTATR